MLTARNRCRRPSYRRHTPSSPIVNLNWMPLRRPQVRCCAPYQPRQSTGSRLCDEVTMGPAVQKGWTSRPSCAAEPTTMVHSRLGVTMHCGERANSLPMQLSGLLRPPSSPIAASFCSEQHLSFKRPPSSAYDSYLSRSSSILMLTTTYLLRRYS